MPLSPFMASLCALNNELCNQIFLKCHILDALRGWACTSEIDSPRQIIWKVLILPPVQSSLTAPSSHHENPCFWGRGVKSSLTGPSCSKMSKDKHAKTWRIL